MQRINTLSTSTMILATFVAVMIILGFSSVMATQIEPMPIKVSYHDLSPKAKHQVECLAQNMYFESGHESEEGQIAVGMVTMNRVKSGDYPTTICGVVKQKVEDTCQFSWYCDGKSDKPTNVKAWREAVTAVRKAYVIYNLGVDISSGAVMYHATYVSPYWKKAYKRITRIDSHIFYSEK